MEGLPHAVVGDLTKISEGGFGDDGADVRVSVEGLEELRAAHGFAEGEDAARMELIVSIEQIVEEVDPLVDVVALEQAVGRELAAAGAVGAGAGEEHGESVGQEELSVSGHADAVVAEAVEEEDGISAGVVWVDGPGAEDDVVWGRDGVVGEIGVEGLRRLADCGDFIFGERAAGGMEGAVGQVDAAEGAESQVEEESEDSVTDEARSGHGLRDGTGGWGVRFQARAELCNHRGH